MVDFRQGETPTPVAVLGAGNLVSHVHRDPDNTYAFNLFRQTATLETTHCFGVEDLRDIVKLCQVLTYSMLDDGWLNEEQREQLLELNEQLDEITRPWGDARHG